MTTAPIHYHVSAPDVRTHLFHVTVTIAQPEREQVVSLPVWIPGSYLVREFARHLQGLCATQQGKSCAVEQLDKHRWLIHSKTRQPLTLHYQVYAHDNSVRTAWLDANRGFFNPTSVCLQVEGQAHLAHSMDIASPEKKWKLATGLSAVNVNKNGFGRYVAHNYDALVDCPVEMGDFWRGTFRAQGIPHTLVVADAGPAFDGERLLRDTQRICDTALQFWHGKQAKKQAPFQRYVFMLNVVHDGYGGLEHRNSTALIASRQDLPRLEQDTTSTGYTTLLGLISHEYFHSWNVKQLRPAHLLPYRYDQENYTELLWFFEGFTSYYDDLLLLRAGLITQAQYLELLSKTLNQVLGTPGRHIHSVAQASFEAWTKYYRQDANTLNATVSYYTKGALVALCLDLTLRQSGSSLDHLMRVLYQHCCEKGLLEEHVVTALQALSGRSFAKEIKEWVHGTKDLPVVKLLRKAGIHVEHKEGTLAQQWGLRVQEGTAITVQNVLRGGLAEQAGLAPGDEWYGVEIDQAGWRVGKLEEVAALLPNTATPRTLLVSRDRRLLRLAWPHWATSAVTTVNLTGQTAATSWPHA